MAEYSSVKLLTPLIKEFRKIGKERKAEIDLIRDIIYGDPENLVRAYVEPDCQMENTADQPIDNFIANRQPALKKIREFLESNTDYQEGNNQLFFLADAGMGKSSLLAMVKMFDLFSFLPKGYNSVLIKANKKTWKKIKSIANRGKTLLLIDAIDETDDNFENGAEYLRRLLDETKPFWRVIFTCRTQYFPQVQFNSNTYHGYAKVMGYTCPVKYLSPFSDSQVAQYLNKAFPKKFFFFKQKEKIKAAQNLIQKMGSLRCRPMLLRHIRQLVPNVEGASQIDGQFKLYEFMVSSWLSREEAKSGIDAKKLWFACEILATHMYRHRIREISPTDLQVLISKIQDVASIKAIQITDRSLLNKTSTGAYCFSHFSFQEFLVAKKVLENNIRPGIVIKPTDLLWEFLREKMATGKFDLSYVDVTDRDFSGLLISEFDFTSCDLVGCDFSKSTIRKCKFSSKIFSPNNFSNCRFEECEFEDADFSGTHGENKRKAELSKTDFSHCKFLGNTLLPANLTEVSFRNCTFSTVTPSPQSNYVKVTWDSINSDQISFSAANFDNFTMGKKSSGNIRFIDCKLDDCTLHSVTGRIQLEKSRLRKCNFAVEGTGAIDFSNCNFDEQSLSTMPNHSEEFSKAVDTNLKFSIAWKRKIGVVRYLYE